MALLNNVSYVGPSAFSEVEINVSVVMEGNVVSEELVDEINVGNVVVEAVVDDRVHPDKNVTKRKLIISKIRFIPRRLLYLLSNF